MSRLHIHSPCGPCPAVNALTVHAQQYHMCSNTSTMQIRIPDRTEEQHRESLVSCWALPIKASHRPGKEALWFVVMCTAQSFRTETHRHGSNEGLAGLSLQLGANELLLLRPRLISYAQKVPNAPQALYQGLPLQGLALLGHMLLSEYIQSLHA